MILNTVLKRLLKFILNSSFNLYFRWHNIKDEEICDPMEKIGV